MVSWISPSGRAGRSDLHRLQGVHPDVPGGDPRHEKPSVWTLECTGCMSCVAACPVEDCLTVTRRGKEGWSPYLIPLVGLGTIFLFWGVARVTGYWHSYVPTPSSPRRTGRRRIFCTRSHISYLSDRICG